MSVTIGYELRCPVSGEWRFRGKKLNCSETQYVCLLNLHENINHETCDGLDYSNRGSKLVFEPFFNKALCSYKRYQPFPFSTDGSSECVYQKSFCSEEGQFVVHEGSLKKDTSCGCDISKQFTFITKPRNNCSCFPSEEDCSCHQLTCNKEDINCNLEYAILMNTSCSKITVTLLPENPKGVRLGKTKHILNNRDNKYNHFCAYCTAGLMIVMVVIMALFVLTCNQYLVRVNLHTNDGNGLFGQHYKPSSGFWAGWYKQCGEKHNFSINLDFNDFKIIGKGVDAIGSYSIDGLWEEDNGIVKFLKHYDGKHDVYYNGNLSENSRSISGKYIVLGDSDKFKMSLKEKSIDSTNVIFY